MSLEAGGRADKGGNIYENRFLAKLWIDLIRERLTSIEVEPLGDEGRGVEFITITADGNREYYQCKASNGMDNFWRPSDLGAYSVFQIAKLHIQSGSNCMYHFVSPLPYDELDSLCDRARTVSDLDDFLSFQLTNDKLRNWWNKCKQYFYEDDFHTLFLLSRCHFDQIPDNHERTHELETIIELLFVNNNSGTPSSIRIALEAFANDEKRWGRPINAREVLAYLEEHGFQQRLLVHDERTLTQIKTLNQAYIESFHPIGSSLFHRCEADKIMECIHNGKSALILGKAGSGKSGCIHKVIENLEAERFTYLILPLDKRQPTGFADHYGRSLGLLCSPVLCLHSLSGGRPCVLIFDQLDALHWTNSSTSTSLSICKEMIDQVERLNRLENGKIRCIFVVRSFDYQTDPTIHRMFEPADGSQSSWEKIEVDLLSSEDVHRLIGGSYNSLSPRLHTLLQTPSNLYIWEKLSPSSKPLIENLRQLMETWWTQVRDRCIDNSLNAQRIDDCRNRIVTIMQRREVLSLPDMLFQDEHNEIDILTSYGVLQKVGNSVSFVHQSLFDFFSVKSYIDSIYDRSMHLPDIFCDTDRQTPDVRYQFLMLLQYLVDADTETFISEAKYSLASSNIRYYFKCCIFEVIGQKASLAEEFWPTIDAYYDNPEWNQYIVHMVLSSHSEFVQLFYRSHPEYAWHEENGCNILRSVICQEPDLALDIICNYGPDKFDDNTLYSILCAISPDDSEKAASLRLKLLERNRLLFLNYFELEKIIESGSAWAVPMLKLVIEMDPTVRQNVHFITLEHTNFFVEKYAKQIVYQLLDPLIQTVISETAQNKYSTVWNTNYNDVTIEQALVHIVQAALSQVASNDPLEFLQYLNSPSTNSSIEKSLRIHAAENLLTDYADQVIIWLISDFDNRAFERFSSESTSLSCCQRIIRRFSPYCCIDIFKQLETFLCHWSPPADYMRAILQWQIKTGHIVGNDNGSTAFWGDLQTILLPALDPSRTSNYTKELICVLTRKFPNGTSFYDLSQNGMAQCISSPIDSHFDRLSDRSWLKLISDMSCSTPNVGKRNWNTGTDSSPQMFARSLAHAAEKDPIRFANLALLFPDGTAELFIDAILTGLKSPDVPLDLTCDILRRFCQNPSRSIAISYAHVIEHRSQEEWPIDILNGLINTATNHADPLPKELPICKINEETADCDTLRQCAINCARGYALFAISDILWDHLELFETFREVTASAVEDENPAVLFSAMRCIAPWYNVDREFSKTLFHRLLERDIRVLGAYDAWQILSRCYNEDPSYYCGILLSAFHSEIKELTGHALEMMTIIATTNSQMLDVLLSLQLSKQQAQVVCHQAVRCFKYDDRRMQSQVILSHIIDICDDLPQLDQLFYQKLVDPQRDKEFLLKLVSRGNMRRMAYYFINYLKEYDGDILAYTDVILEFIKALFLPGTTYYSFDELIICIARLFHQGKEDLQIRRACLDMWDITYHNRPWAIKPFAELIDQL